MKPTPKHAESLRGNMEKARCSPRYIHFVGAKPNHPWRAMKFGKGKPK